jgi:hypothetical protein
MPVGSKQLLPKTDLSMNALQYYIIDTIIRDPSYHPAYKSNRDLETRGAYGSVSESILDEDEDK